MRGPNPYRARLGILLLALLAPASASAATVEEYGLQLLPDQTVTYKVDLPVVHPGRLVLEADWSGSRVLSFRIVRPGRPPVRKSGPSPLRMELDVRPEDAGRLRTWTLWIRGLPARAGAEGKLRVAFPDREPDPTAPTPSTPARIEESEGFPWRQPAAAPPSLHPERRRLHQRTERFRRLVIDDSGMPHPDSHLWQDEMLRFLVERRDGPSKGTPPLAESTRRWLRRLAEAVRKIEDLRTADDPILGGPPPDKRSSYRAWVALRSRDLDPLEVELDDLFHDVHDGYAPELEGREWITRFLSCLIVCEQYFDERVRLGEAAAGHADVAAAQWKPILAAVDALSAIP